MQLYRVVKSQKSNWPYFSYLVEYITFTKLDHEACNVNFVAFWLVIGFFISYEFVLLC